jgi:hypothetical protein
MMMIVSVVVDDVVVVARPPPIRARECVPPWVRVARDAVEVERLRSVEKETLPW